MQCLAYAYTQRDPDALAALLSTDPAAEYRGPFDLGPTEEVCLHRRFFRPESPIPDQPPVPAELWISGIAVSLIPLREWAERPDLYRSASNPQGLDPQRWKAFETDYHAEILVMMLSNTNFRSSSSFSFVVIRDLAGPSGEARREYLYRWQDLTGVAARASAGADAALQPARSGWLEFLERFRCQ